MKATVNVLIGSSNNKPVVLLSIDSPELDKIELDFTMQEAQQLGLAMLVSCGIAVERFK